MNDTCWSLPIRRGSFLIGVNRVVRKEVPPLSDVFVPLLSPDLDLLLFSTTSEIILLKSLVLEFCTGTRLDKDDLRIRKQTYDPGGYW